MTKYNLKTGSKDTGQGSFWAVLMTLFISLSLMACNLTGGGKSDSSSGGEAPKSSDATPVSTAAPEIISTTPSADAVIVGDTIESNFLFSVDMKPIAGQKLNYSWKMKNVGFDNEFDVTTATGNSAMSWDCLQILQEPNMTLTVTVSNDQGVKVSKTWNLSLQRQAIFVSEQGNDQFVGNRWYPVRTLSKAVQLAKAGNIPNVVVAKGQYSGSIAISSIVNLRGGYATDFHSVDPALNETVVSTNAQGLLFQQVQAQKIEVTGFTFKSDKSTNYDYNASSYPVRVWSSRGIEFSNNIFISNDGMDGANGASGAAGLDGYAGGIATSGVSKTSVHDIVGAGGASGYSPCGSTGGKGADGAKAQANPVAALSGGYGLGLQLNSYGSGGFGGASTTVQNNFGGNGSSGVNGTTSTLTGSNGIAADNHGVPQLGAFGWQPFLYSSDGASGGNGGGGGGGGGGGAYVYAVFLNGLYQSGAGGGGGGAGGCGGSGGKAGKSGGGSFGAMVIDSLDIKFTKNKFITGKGGNGGNGGEGGLGGSGGLGGTGAPYLAREGSGGAGGRGGSGAKGGSGGAGAGGPAAGILNVGSTLVQSANIFQVGIAGSGGLGGLAGLRSDVLELNP